ncbi:hypothetical protein [Actinoallomurus sp. NPDC050550]|uniref:hypothetical protein n=1 Tax=Actinoallomurus sp. NPDC050550 TaxID=3154937 RepID=UPI0033F793C6
MLSSQATFRYQPLHGTPAGLRYGRVAPGGCDVTGDVADPLVRLPLFAAMNEAELDCVVETVVSYSRSR